MYGRNKGGEGVSTPRRKKMNEVGGGENSKRLQAKKDTLALYGIFLSRTGGTVKKKVSTLFIASGATYHSKRASIIHALAFGSCWRFSYLFSLRFLLLVPSRTHRKKWIPVASVVSAMLPSFWISTFPYISSPRARRRKKHTSWDENHHRPSLPFRTFLPSSSRFSALSSFPPSSH